MPTPRSELGLVATLMLITWILIALAIIVTSLIATALASEVGHGDWSGAVFWDVGRDVARARYVTLPYLALAALLSVFFSSWTSGTLLAAAVAAGYFFFELFSVGRLIKLFEDQSAFGWVGTAADYDLGWNTAAWMFGRGGEPISGFALAGAIGVADYPGEIHAFGVQLVFLIAILALTFWLFYRRDVAGPSG